MQNKLLKLLLHLDRLTPTNKLHKHLNILKISDLCKCSVLSFVNDTQLGECPEIFENYFEKKHSNYDLRQKGQLVVPTARLALGDRALRTNDAKLWNKIHKDNLHLQYRNKPSLRKHLVYISLWDWLKLAIWRQKIKQHYVNITGWNCAIRSSLGRAVALTTIFYIIFLPPAR